MERLTEIETRMAAIKTELDAEGADLDALETEVRSLNDEKAKINEAIEKRNSILADVDKNGKIIKTFEERKPNMEFENMTREEIIASAEYRSAWLKTLQRKDLTEVEKRSVAATNVSGAIPTQTSDQIISKVVQMAPLLGEVTLLHVAGNVNFAVEGTNNAAAIHTENALIDAAADTLVTVSLAGYEIVKLIRISATVQTMTINAFEGWLTDMLAEAIARKIEYYLIYGSGTGQPKGVQYANTWSDTSNGVDWAGATPTFAEICELISYLGGGYARNAKFLMNHKTFWTDIQAIRDDGKAPIVAKDGDGYRILGFPVLFSDYCADGEIFLGDFKKIVANLAQDISVAASADSGFAYNAIDYRGTAIFDCDIAVAGAFVKGEATLA